MLAKLKYLLIIPFVFLFLWAVAWGLADLVANNVTPYESRWLEKQSVASLHEWQQAEGLMQLAVMLNRQNPEYVERLGRLYLWRIYVEDAPIGSFEEFQQHLNTGLDYLRSAVEKRPTWPLTWGFLLEMKSIAGQIDGEYWQVWDKASELGRWEVSLQAQMLESGLTHWDILTEEEKNKVLAVFYDMLSKRYSDGRGIDIVDSVGALPLFCDITPSELFTVNLQRDCDAIEFVEQTEQALPEESESASESILLIQP